MVSCGAMNSLLFQPKKVGTYCKSWMDHTIAVPTLLLFMFNTILRQDILRHHSLFSLVATESDFPSFHMLIAPLIAMRSAHSHGPITQPVSIVIRKQKIVHILKIPCSF